MYPDRITAEKLLAEAEKCNPGPWGNHSRTAAHCAEKIAESAGLDKEKAYVLGLLHDIGSKFGVRHLGHVSDGYSYMNGVKENDLVTITATGNAEVTVGSGESSHTKWIETDPSALQP